MPCGETWSRSETLWRGNENNDIACRAFIYFASSGLSLWDQRAVKITMKLQDVLIYSVSENCTIALGYAQLSPFYPASLPGYAQLSPFYPASLPGYAQLSPFYPASLPGSRSCNRIKRGPGNEATFYPQRH